MNTGVKITAFAAAVAATFAASYGLGAALDPASPAPAPSAHAAGHDRADSGSRGAHGGHSDETPAGLQISEAGYRLDLRTARIPADETSELRFVIRDRDGRPVDDYRTEHGKELHLILASRDLVTYRHLHPTRAADGTWSTRVSLPAAGTYRLFADFTPAAEDATDLTLGADLAVSGTYAAPALPEPAATTTVDGYTVTLSGGLRPGKAGELTLTVSRNGRPVTDLEPYLGAYGHLVALRAGDLAYLHVHPNGEPGDGRTTPGPEIRFTATAPTVGTYRLFLDFQHDGTVRTAAFTVRNDAPEPAATPTAPDGTGKEHGGGHQH
ncbi:hypothetical protein [Streptomyces chromofuscus]|uniref:Secreted protein n=1 Tax=Streptomyces chromofuscus TaxID=42881 RepID=A0A7M2T7X5_STRCW|nr:hypothetical protein [Streptomyces chromofuscus]QOV44807.1 hypothetical protein IPT68_01970 [Streptomyces chromofuscus]GGT00064.1 hypothetical protein GCM10010254_20110 [Streptomyces chromofuscus]